MCCYAKCRIFTPMSLVMLRVTIMSIHRLSDTMLSVAMLSVAILSVVMLKACKNIFLSVLSVIMLIVVAPFLQDTQTFYFYWCFTIID